MSRGLATILQVAVSLTLLALLARRVAFDAMLAAFRHMHPLTLAYATALALVGYTGRAERWRLLLARAGHALPRGRAYVLTLAGTAYGLVTPGRVGEFARVLHLDAPRSSTLPSVLWERAGDLLMLEAMALPAFLVLPACRGVLLLTYLALVLATLAFVLLLDRPRLALGLVSRVPALAPALGRMMAGTAGMLSDPVFRRGLLHGALFYVFAYSASWLLARDLAPQASPLLLLVLPVIPLLGNLPIAFGGLGLREHVSATLFTGIGLGPAVGTAFSLTWFATVTLVPALVGLVLLRVPGVHGSPQPRGMEAR